MMYLIAFSEFYYTKQITSNLKNATLFIIKVAMTQYIAEGWALYFKPGLYYYILGVK